MICQVNVCHECLGLETIAQELFKQGHQHLIAECGTCGSKHYFKREDYNLKVVLITRAMCGGCFQVKELLSAHEIHYQELDAQSNIGMSLLSLCSIGPDTVLPCIICDCYGDMEALEVIFRDSGIPITFTVGKK